MATYLVTGGCGFIGSHLTEQLLSQGHRVRVLDDLSTGKRENLPAGATLMVEDVANPASVIRAFKGIDGCFHLAAVASVQQSNEHWLQCHRINQQGSLNVFEAARQRKTPVVYASSAAVYGDSASVPLKETGPVRPLTAYGADKLGAELHARVGSLVHGVPTLGLRFFNVFGPRQDPSSPYSGVISIFVDRILKGETIDIFGDGEQTRDFIYVGDVVRFLCAGMAKIDCNSKVYNVCTGDTVSIGQLAKMVMTIAGVKVPIQFHASRKGDIRTSVGDPKQASIGLNLSAKYPLANGLDKLIESIQLPAHA